jgi:hypothetical protein
MTATSPPDVPDASRLDRKRIALLPVKTHWTRNPEIGLGKLAGVFWIGTKGCSEVKLSGLD